MFDVFQVVFAFEIPHMREHQELDMSRWFQNILSVLEFKMDYSALEEQQYSM